MLLMESAEKTASTQQDRGHFRVVQQDRGHFKVVPETCILTLHCYKSGDKFEPLYTGCFAIIEYLISSFIDDFNWTLIVI